MSYSIKEAAEKLTVSEITLRRIIYRGEINYHKIGKIYRLTEDDIACYIKSIKKSKDDTAGETTIPANVVLSDEIVRKIERETGNLRHGVVRFALHIVDGKPVRYIVSREQSVLWDKDGDKALDHPEQAEPAERVEKW
jgi:excisionase family DNA binding protein